MLQQKKKTEKSKQDLPKWLTDKYIVHNTRCIPRGTRVEVNMYTITKEQATALAKSHPEILQLKTGQAAEQEIAETSKK